jgi:hypothetical protein
MWRPSLNGTVMVIQLIVIGMLTIMLAVSNMLVRDANYAAHLFHEELMQMDRDCTCVTDGGVP